MTLAKHRDMTKPGNDDNAEEDHSSSSTYTMSESCLGTSYNGFLGGSSHAGVPVICTGNSSFQHLLLLNSSGNHHNNSTNDNSKGGGGVFLDCLDLLVITNVWERIKRLMGGGYRQAFGEILICHMMAHTESNVRLQLGFASFRSPQFVQVSNRLVDCIEVLVTLLGPDMEEKELMQVGHDLIQLGVKLSLFGKSMACALQEVLGGNDKFPKDDFDVCDRIFRGVCDKILDG